jgi:hypothetical protein
LRCISEPWLFHLPDAALIGDVIQELEMGGFRGRIEKKKLCEK